MINGQNVTLHLKNIKNFNSANLLKVSVIISKWDKLNLFVL